MGIAPILPLSNVEDVVRDALEKLPAVIFMKQLIASGELPMAFQGSRMQQREWVNIVEKEQLYLFSFYVQNVVGDVRYVSNFLDYL